MTLLKFIFWDLGGVVVDLDFQGMMREALEKFNISQSDLLPLIHEEFKMPPSHYSLTEKAVAGLLTKEEYIAGIKESLNGKINEPDIEYLLQRVLTREKYATVALIQKLSKNGIHQACMSNIDQIHWERIQMFPSINGLFDKKFLSFEQKLVKPHMAAFDRILEMLACKKDELIFIDDREDNIQSAHHYGIDAIQFIDHASLYTALAERGLPVQ